ncbi:acyl-CoA dehydrogenase family protein [Rhodococcoides fascians]|uniref:acyl-CoA dehydrogenase family protein n=1 Tax=Rhodococcoides fascians TaxID=1828 RepID=UPI00055BBA42|nr:acyl-CoA dehydrogenase [Rhodococcus fascians]
MDFELTDEQQLLRQVARDVLSNSYDLTSLNDVAETDLGWGRDVWNQFAEMGLLGLGFGPEDGDQIEITVVMNELGRRLAPEPLAAAALIPGGLIAESGSEEQKAVLEDVASGRALLAFAHCEPGMRVPSDQVITSAERAGDRWTLTGRKNPVLAGGSAHKLIVTGLLPGGGTGLFLVDADAVRQYSYRTFDGRRAAQIDFDATPAEPLGTGGDASELIRRTVIRQQSALCAEAVGAMEEALRLTTDYLASRKQFGVPLSSFQTLTQRAADMYVSLELARSMSQYAAMVIADGIFNETIAARVKLQIGRSGRHIAQEAIQLHGGIGVTAEYPVAHYAARLTAIDNTFGTAGDHLRTLSREVADYVSG